MRFIHGGLMQQRNCMILTVALLAPLLLVCNYRIIVGLMNNDMVSAAANEQEQEDTPSYLFLKPIKGGVLPIRRFTIAGGTLIKNYDAGDIHLCNDLCLELDQCDAWEFQNMTTSSMDAGVTSNERKTSSNTTCSLFNNDPNNPIDFHQAANNSPRNMVGFAQKRSRVLSSKSQMVELKRREKILYILHFHHEVIPRVYANILNKILPSSWMADFMDLVVVTPREVPLVANGIKESDRASSLVNPFSPVRNETSGELVSRRGALGHMSEPIARAKFPGYGGYLLVNDDAMLKVWDLEQKMWFADRPWGTFSPHVYREQVWSPRINRKRYPYGNYGWSWYNHDSGTVSAHKEFTRSNFDAALDAMNELCMNKTNITMGMESVQVEEFCTNRTKDVLRPYPGGGGKADALYVPGNELGATISKSLTLFGEHDVMMEIAYPIVTNVVVPKGKMLEMPLCDASVQTLKSEYKPGVMKFRPYFTLSREEGKSLDCPTIHPIKFGMEDAILYWKNVVNRTCTWCTWYNSSSDEVFWKLVQ